MLECQTLMSAVAISALHDVHSIYGSGTKVRSSAQHETALLAQAMLVGRATGAYPHLMHSLGACIGQTCCWRARNFLHLATMAVLSSAVLQLNNAPLPAGEGGAGVLEANGGENRLEAAGVCHAETERKRASFRPLG